MTNYTQVRGVCWISLGGSRFDEIGPDARREGRVEMRLSQPSFATPHMGAAGRARTCEAVQRRRLSALATLLGCATQTRPRAHLVKTLRGVAGLRGSACALPRRINRQPSGLPWAWRAACCLSWQTRRLSKARPFVSSRAWQPIPPSQRATPREIQQAPSLALSFAYFPRLSGFFRYLKKSELGSSTIKSLLLRKLFR